MTLSAEACVRACVHIRVCDSHSPAILWSADHDFGDRAQKY